MTNETLIKFNASSFHVLFYTSQVPFEGNKLICQHDQEYQVERDGEGSWEMKRCIERIG